MNDGDAAGHRSPRRRSPRSVRCPACKAAEPQQVGVAVVVAHNGALLDANPNRSVPVALGVAADARAQPDGDRLRSRTACARATSSSTARRTSKGHFVVGEKVHVVSQVGSTRVHARRRRDLRRRRQRGRCPGAWRSRRRRRPRVLGTPGRYDAIQVVAAPGVSQQQVVANIRTALHDPSTEVITGAGGHGREPRRRPVRRCSSSTCS